MGKWQGTLLPHAKPVLQTPNLFPIFSSNYWRVFFKLHAPDFVNLNTRAHSNFSLFFHFIYLFFYSNPYDAVSREIPTPHAFSLSFLPSFVVVKIWDFWDYYITTSNNGSISQVRSDPFKSLLFFFTSLSLSPVFQFLFPIYFSLLILCIFCFDLPPNSRGVVFPWWGSF